MPIKPTGQSLVSNLSNFLVNKNSANNIGGTFAQLNANKNSLKSLVQFSPASLKASASLNSLQSRLSGQQESLTFIRRFLETVDQSLRELSGRVSDQQRYRNTPINISDNQFSQDTGTGTNATAVTTELSINDFTTAYNGLLNDSVTTDASGPSVANVVNDLQVTLDSPPTGPPPPSAPDATPTTDFYTSATSTADLEIAQSSTQADSSSGSGFIRALDFADQSTTQNSEANQSLQSLIGSFQPTTGPATPVGASQDLSSLELDFSDLGELTASNEQEFLDRIDAARKTVAGFTTTVNQAIAGVNFAP
ncbi:hypothetical protein JYT83_00780 [bacterium AH-315-F18]|nr:hypothetical protein [bacterium AH-315-F18]